MWPSSEPGLLSRREKGEREGKGNEERESERPRARARAKAKGSPAHHRGAGYRGTNSLTRFTRWPRMSGILVARWVAVGDGFWGGGEGEEGGRREYL